MLKANERRITFEASMLAQNDLLPETDYLPCLYRKGSSGDRSGAKVVDSMIYNFLTGANLAEMQAKSSYLPKLGTPIAFPASARCRRPRCRI